MVLVIDIKLAPCGHVLYIGMRIGTGTATVRAGGRGRTYNIDTTVPGDGDGRVKGSEINSYKEGQTSVYRDILKRTGG